MNPHTGELARMSDLSAEAKRDFVPVPSIFEKLAQRKIEAAQRDEQRAVVNMRSNHPLAKWGRAEREKKKRKAKIAAASRRRNRK